MLDHPAFAPPPPAQRRPLSLPPRPRRCQWIEGEPSRRETCKCRAPVASVGSYCMAHRLRALRPPAFVLILQILTKEPRR
jgi:hypothetical protein